MNGTEERNVTLQWCPTCRRRREVVDRSEESVLEPKGERIVRVIHLECEHDIVDETGRFIPWA